MVFLEDFRGAAVWLEWLGKFIGNWGAALNLGRRFVELTLPQAKKYNPFRVEKAFELTFYPAGIFLSMNGEEKMYENPWRVCAAMGRGVRPGHRDPM